MRVRLLQDPAEFNALMPAWERLERDVELTPMQHGIWFQSCIKHFAQNGRLRVLIAEENGEIQAALPLALSVDNTALEWLGAEIYEPCRLISRNNEAMAQVAHAAASLKTAIHIKRLMSDSPGFTPFEQAFRRHGVLIARPDIGAPVLPLDERLTEPERLLNSGRRSDLRRARRIAETWGPISIEIVAPTAETVDTDLDLAFDVEAASWKRQAMSAMAVDPVRGPFYRTYAAAASRKGILRLCFLRLGSQVAAMQLAIESENRFWLMKIGFDDRYARCSPGQLLLWEVLKEMARKQIRSVEFLGQSESWIKVWTPDERTCLTLRGYPFTFKNVTRLAGDVMRSAWRKLERV
jgi:CelD/BcsL family acetyltransferase involved in cellulose biosynthesis